MAAGKMSALKNRYSSAIPQRATQEPPKKEPKPRDPRPNKKDNSREL
jgi:hypothetical protein